MKPETKDWVKRTAGTSAAIATPGIVAASLLGGLPLGLAVGGAVAAGNVIGSVAYKKAKDVKEDLENRRKFRELQKHVLAQNGILYYQPMVSVSNSDMSCSKDMSCLGKILKKDFTISKFVGNALDGTPVMQALDKVVSAADNLGEGWIVRNGHTVRGEVRRLKGFSEESLLSVEDNEIKNMADDILYTNSSEDKELKRSRYLSMLDENSRDKLLDILSERDKGNAEVNPPTPPISAFSECRSLNSIAKGRDFGILSVLSAASKPLKAAAKLAGNASKNSELIEKATSNAVKAAEGVSKSAETGGALGKVASGIGKFGGKVKAAFTGETASKAAEKAVDKGEEVAEGAAKAGEEALKEEAKNNLKIGNNEPTEVKTKLSELDPNNMNKFELKGVKMAANSRISAGIAERIGYENLGRASKALEAGAARQNAEAAMKRNNENQER